MDRQQLTTRTTFPRNPHGSEGHGSNGPDNRPVLGQWVKTNGYQE